MQRGLLLLCLAAMVALFSGVAASPGSTASCGGNQDQTGLSTFLLPMEAWSIAHDLAAIDCLVVLIQQYNQRIEISRAWTLADAIFSISIKYDLDPLWVASIIAAESSFNPRARSHCGAEGLMQLTQSVQPWLGVTDPFDIWQNVSGGCQYLAYLRRRFDRPELVLAAYNAGPTRVARLARIPAIKETVRYIHSVTALHARLTTEVHSLTKITVSFPPFFRERPALAAYGSFASPVRRFIALFGQITPGLGGPSAQASLQRRFPCRPPGPADIFLPGFDVDRDPVSTILYIS